MRYGTVRHGGRTHGARVEGDRAVVLDAPDALAATEPGRVAREVADLPVAAADWAPLVPAPPHILCVGLNYRAHVAELGRALPEAPALFAKYASTLTGARDPITLPGISDRIQGEVELAVVVGRRIHRADLATAGRAIAGCTVANDLSMRDWQHRTGEALAGKVFDASTPLGPLLVTPDEVDDARDLELTSMSTVPSGSAEGRRT